MSKNKPSKKDEYYTGIYWKDYEEAAKVFAVELAKVIEENEERENNEPPKDKK